MTPLRGTNACYVHDERVLYALVCAWQIRHSSQVLHVKQSGASCTFEFMSTVCSPHSLLTILTLSASDSRLWIPLSGKTLHQQTMDVTLCRHDNKSNVHPTICYFKNNSQMHFYNLISQKWNYIYIYNCLSRIIFEVRYRGYALCQFRSIGNISISARFELESWNLTRICGSLFALLCQISAV